MSDHVLCGRGSGMSLQTHSVAYAFQAAKLVKQAKFIVGVQLKHTQCVKVNT